jgi:hypothetical protein
MIPIDFLPDEVLLEIFDFCPDTSTHPPSKQRIEAWQSLVHVCQRWRSIVFGSPRRLNLRLVCTAKMRLRDMLDIWPPLPLVIQSGLFHGNRPTGRADNIVAALERRDRVHRIELRPINSSSWELFLAAMQEPFPELTYLFLESHTETMLVIPDSLLGGSAPHLIHLALHNIPFPGLPKLLLSATHLVYLHLVNIPYSGYISSEAIVTVLPTLTSLAELSLEFKFPRSHPDRASRRPPPLTRTVLSVLTRFSFKGLYEYLDDLVVRIDAPRVNDLSITYFNDIIFDAPQFIQFIGRTLTSRALEIAHVVFRDRAASVNFLSQTNEKRSLKVGISCRSLGWQVSSLEQVCTSCLPPLSSMEDLYIYDHPDWRDNIGSTQWLELLHPFATVRNLYLSKDFASHIVPALHELIESSEATEVLPTLQNIFLEGLQPSGPVQEGIEKFVAARHLFGHTIAVSRWERDPKLFPRWEWLWEGG